jgi:hypothetical protein
LRGEPYFFKKNKYSFARANLLWCYGTCSIGVLTMPLSKV